MEPFRGSKYIALIEPFLKMFEMAFKSEHTVVLFIEITGVSRAKIL